VDWARHIAKARYCRPEFVSAAVITFLALIEMTLILRATDGHLLFTLDDPFIHLALAQRIVDGRGYGLNLGVPAAPSSSIIFPFLLIPLLSLRQAGPLLLNYGAALASGGLFCAGLRQAGWPIDRCGTMLFGACAICVVMATNLLGLIFSGMEHALQLALTLACVVGAQRYCVRQRVDDWWLGAAMVSPLVRYEGLSNLLAVSIMLAWGGRRRLALALVMAGITLPLLFALWLHWSGLPPVPGSVLEKAGTGMFAAGGSTYLRFWWQNRIFQFAAAPLAWVSAALCAAVYLARRRADAKGVKIAIFGMLIVLPQLFLGRFNSFSRYEIYAVGGGLLAFLASVAPIVSSWRLSPLNMFALLACPVVAAGFPYVQRAFELPRAASGIYRQQYQMHRFATSFWRDAVAVNDIGLVSYENPYPVIDLWGLGSEAARQSRQRDSNPEWMDRLMRQSSAGLAMIYPDWFPALPPAWQMVGLLRLRHGYLVNGGRQVGFYATDAEALPRIKAALHDFVPTLPKNSDFVWR
jgi:hypothetical protein